MTTTIIQGASRITIEDATPETLAKPEPLPSLPAIGAPWPGIDGIYAGIVGAEGNHGNSHLVTRDLKYMESKLRGIANMHGLEYNYAHA